jgi:hypothetical protein
VDNTDLTITVANARRQLAAVLELVDSGSLTAGPDQRAWLRGAVDALQTVLDQPVSPSK